MWFVIATRTLRSGPPWGDLQVRPEPARGTCFHVGEMLGAGDDDTLEIVALEERTASNRGSGDSRSAWGVPTRVQLRASLQASAPAVVA
jgi:hypothetical protein